MHQTSGHNNSYLLGVQLKHKYFALNLQLEFATTLIFGWWEDVVIWRVEWKCATGDSGEQCVMTSGISEMQLLSADNSDSIQRVNYCKI